MQTGGPKEAGRVVRGAAAGRPPRPHDTRQLINKIRISYPALRASRVDESLRNSLLAELLTQSYNEGKSVVVPQGMRFQPLPPDQFNKYREAMSGLTADNANEVQKKLIELGLAPNAGVGLPGDVEMKGPGDPEFKRLSSTAIGALGAEQGE